MKVRIAGVPSQTRRVRVAHTPTSEIPENGMSPEMGNGGSMPGGDGRYASQQTGHGYALNRWGQWASPAGYPGTTSQVNPYASVGSTLPEAKDGGDVIMAPEMGGYFRRVKK